MVASVILAHPYKRSFNHAIFRTVVDSLRGRGVKTYGHDLYAENFDPVLTEAELGKEPTKDSLVKRLTEEMVESDLLVFIHPNWWGQPPAMMMGYIDRGFRPPYAYDYEETATGGGPPIEKLCGKTGIVFNTSNTPERRELDYFHDPLENEWRWCVFGFCGITRYHRTMFRVVADSMEEQRKGWLREVEDVLSRHLSAEAGS